MKAAVLVIGLTALVATACAHVAPLILPAQTLVRTPQYDSAIVHSDRVGDSFAYSSIEGHAYRTLNPFVQSTYPLQYRYLNTVPLALPTHNYYVPNYVYNLNPIQPAEIPTNAGRPAAEAPSKSPQTPPESPERPESAQPDADAEPLPAQPAADEQPATNNDQPEAEQPESPQEEPTPAQDEPANKPDKEDDSESVEAA